MCQKLLTILEFAQNVSYHIHGTCLLLDIYVGRWWSHRHQQKPDILMSGHLQLCWWQQKNHIFCWKIRLSLSWLKQTRYLNKTSAQFLTVFVSSEKSTLSRTMMLSYLWPSVVYALTYPEHKLCNKREINLKKFKVATKKHKVLTLSLCRGRLR